MSGATSHQATTALILIEGLLDWLSIKLSGLTSRRNLISHLFLLSLEMNTNLTKPYSSPDFDLEQYKIVILSLGCSGLLILLLLLLCYCRARARQKILP